jgi:hypothetical protein
MSATPEEPVAASDSHSGQASLPDSAPSQRKGLPAVWLLAFAALGLALIATVLSAHALGKATRSEQRLADLVSAAPAASPAAVEEAAGDQPGPTSPSPLPPAGQTRPPESPAVESPDAPDVLNPRATFTLAYAEEVLTVRALSRSTAYLDLDEPRVGVERGADMAMAVSTSNPIPYFFFQDGVVAAEATSAELSAHDCRELIRTGPLPRGTQVPAQRGLVLCVATSAEQAATEGISQKIAVLHVTALSEEGRATVHVTAWEVPR